MRVFVTGASGVIGRRVVPLLVSAGHEVTAVGRTPEKRGALTRAGAEAVGVDLFDGAALRRVLRGHDAVVNLATHMPASTTKMLLPWSWRENDRVRKEGSAILVEAALDAGVPRFLQESFAPAYPDRGATWIEESTLLAPVAYNRSILDAERSAERFTAAGGTGVVLRFGAFYGPDAFTLHDMVKMVCRGWSALGGPPVAYLASIAHVDAPTAVVAALDIPAEVYNISDDEPLTRREYVDALAEGAGVGRPKSMPSWTTALMGSLGELLTRSVRMSNRKLRRAAPGWAPRFPSAREGLREALAIPTGSRRPAA